MATGRLTPLLNRFRARGPFIKQTSFILFNFMTWIPAVIWFNSNVGDIVWIQGGSMYPYLNTDINRTTKKDACWNSKWEPLEGLRRGMIVSFWSPPHPEVEAVKRVIGLEGDIVFTRKPFPNPRATVPAGHIWVEGDGGHNGKETLDSNTYGPIPMNLVTGRVTYSLWPWRTFGPINWWEWKPKTRVIKAKRRIR